MSDTENRDKAADLKLRGNDDEITRNLLSVLQTPEANPEANPDLLANYRRFVGKLATAKNKNEAWGIAKCWAPDELWRSIGFDLATDEERQAFIFG